MTEPRLIHHIGILVEDLDAAITHWSEVLGYSFTPIARYRTSSYADHSDPEPHFHDARIAFSIEGAPYIELMEFTGEGTHSRHQGEGFHHFGFVEYPDVQARMDALASIGVPDDGKSLDADGNVILWFTEKSALNGIRLEYVSSDPQPVVADDGSPLGVDGNGNPSLGLDTGA
jgi:catechol 2,3-dioxygenase-like lactoylglutathione lyase family enzyme